MQYVGKEFSKGEVEALRDEFCGKGFVKLNGFFSMEYIDHIKRGIDASIDDPVDQYQTGFNRIGFDLFADDPIVMGLMSDVTFRGTLTSITGRRLFYTQGLAFELEKKQELRISLAHWHPKLWLSEGQRFRVHDLDSLGRDKHKWTKGGHGLCSGKHRFR